jgi:hypothetical protein
MYTFGNIKLIFFKGEQMIADQLVDTGLWDLLWTRVSQGLKPNRETNSVTPESNNNNNNQNQEDTARPAETIQDPDWVLISPNGLISVIQLTSKMLTMVRMQKNI